MRSILLLLLVMGLPYFASGDAVASDNESITEIGEVVVTATRYEEKLSTVPAHVTVITRGDIEHSTAQNIPDLLRNEVGVQVSDIGGNKKSFTVDLRGFGETAPLNTLVLIDGRRLNQADLSGVDWTQIPLDRVERIEVVRGGRGAILYGDNAAGGVINIITKDGDEFKAGMTVEGGSYKSYKESAHVSGSAGNLSYSLTASYLDADGYRDNSNTEAKDGGVALTYYVGDNLRLNLSSGYHEDNTGLPGALKESDFASGSKRTDSLNPLDFADIEDYYIKGGPEFSFWGDSFATIDASFRKRDFLSFSSFTGGDFTGDTSIETVAFSPRVVIKRGLGGFDQALTFGADYQRATEEIVNNSLFFGTRTIKSFQLEKRDYGYYLHDEVTVRDNLTLSGGYRYDRAEYEFTPGTPGEVTADEDTFTAGINYGFLKGAHVYASFAKSFRYPVLDEYFSFFTNTVSTTLLPQRSDNYEVGVSHNITERISAQLNLFRIDTEREIFYNANTFANENLDGETRRDGVEISVTARPTDLVTLKASYTYLDAKIKGGQFTGNDIPGVARRKATAGVVVNPGKGVSIALNGHYVGTRPFISDFNNNFGSQESYTILDTKVTYNWNRLTAFLNVNNLTDEKYSEYGVLGGFPTERAFYPSPERNYLFGISAEY
ncbi:MAG: TonB-dependent receptor [Deltaproteobacteria bacterium]|nr:TonB-dependent receptor [Deltaproteobacteria bacterium]